MRNALKYMVYGSSDTFDVDRIIDLLGSYEKFVAVRDTGDGTAYKVDGVRNGVYVGQAGDSRGTKALASEDGAAARSALDAYRAQLEEEQLLGDDVFGRVVPTTPAPATPLPKPDPAPIEATGADSASKAREALRFFFSANGEIFRTFLLDEVVRAADALSREALMTLTATPVARALDALPAPPFVKSANRALLDALAPPLTEKDEKVLASIRKLLAFFAGEYDPTADADVVSASTGGGTSATASGSWTLTGLDPATLEQAQELLPVLQEYRIESRDFAAQIVARLAELQASRAIGFFRDRVTQSA